MAEPEFTTEELANEEWRPVVGYDGYYSVSTLGRVRRDLTNSNTQAGRILKPGIGDSGYPNVTLCVNGQSRTRRVHILVAEAFLGHAPVGEEVNHKDDNRTNARLSNLEYGTHKRNMEHAREANRTAKGSRHRSRLYPDSIIRGESHPSAKLSDEDVGQVRALLADGVKQSVIAAHFKVARTTISAISTGRNRRSTNRQSPVQ